MTRTLYRAASLFLLALLWVLVSSASTPDYGMDGVSRSSMFGTSIWRPRSDWDYDGKRILGHIGFDVYLWDAQTGRVLQKFVGHRDSIFSLQFSPDGKYVLSSSGLYEVGDFIPKCGPKDTSTRLWNALNGKQIWKLDGQIVAEFSPDGHRLLTFSIRQSCTDAAGLSMWDVASGSKLFDVRPSVLPSKSGLTISAMLARVGFSPDGSAFVCWDGINSAALYSAKNGDEIGRVGPAYSFNFYGEQGKVVTYGPNGIDVWSPSAQRLRQMFAPDEDATNKERWRHGAAWTVDGKTLVNVSSWGCSLRVWNFDSGSVIAVKAPECQEPLVDPDSTRVLLWSGGGGVNRNTTPLRFSMYDLNTGRELWQSETAAFDILGFSPDGKTFLIGGPVFTVYSSGSGKPLTKLDILGAHLGDGLGL